MSDTKRIKAQFLIDATTEQAKVVANYLHELLDDGNNVDIMVEVEDVLEPQS